LTYSVEQFFSFRVTNQWNPLLAEVVTASSLNVFKGRLDKFWDNCLFHRIQKHFQDTITDQLKGRPGLIYKAEEEGKGNYKYDRT